MARLLNNPIPKTDIKTEFIPFVGGLNLVTPAVMIPPGQCIDAINYEPSINGGYTRIKGYERFDGRPAPSEVVITSLACTITGVLVAGDLVEQGAVNGRYIKAVTGGILLGNVTGTFLGSTALTVSAVNVGTTAASAPLALARSASAAAQDKVDAADIYRAYITSVPGSGPVRGVWLYGGVVYAWRDNAGATACILHRSSASGWVAVTMPYEVSFFAGSSAFAEGVTVRGNTSLATGVVRRVVLQTGDWSGTGVGKLVVDTVSGTFQNGESLRSSANAYATNRATCVGTQAQVSFPAGGKYRFQTYNFFGGSTTNRVYGVNGVGPAFEFDGTTVVPIRTGATTDTPSYVRCQRRYLYLGQGSSVQNSSVGEPYRFVTAEGAAEYAVGDTVTGLETLPGQSLGIFTRNQTQALIGASIDDWTLQPIAPESGALPYTTAVVRMAYALDDRGITAVSPSQDYGNFSFETVSRLVQPMVNQLKGLAVDCCLVRDKNQVRWFFSDGRTLVMYMEGTQVAAIMLLLYPDVPNVVCSQEDTTGIERVFMGSTDGYVYELNKGSTFDGSAIESMVRIPYYSARAPRTRKRYRRVSIEIDADLYTGITIRPDFNYGDALVSAADNETIDTHLNESIISAGTGGIWDAVQWDSFFWDAEQVNAPSFSVAGTALNMSILFTSNTTLDFGHTLQGLIMHYTPRRLQR